MKADPFSQSPDDDNLAVYRRLMRYTLRYWRVLLLAFAGYALFAAMEAAAASFLGFVVEQINARSPDMAIQIPLLILLISIGRGVGSFIGDYGISQAARNVVNNLRCEMFARMMLLPARHFTEVSTGHMAARLTYNVEQVTAAATDSAKILFKNGFTVIGLLGYMLWMNWLLTLILFAFLPFVGLLVRAASRRFRKLSRRLQTSVGQITHVASEAINGVQVVKLFGGIESERHRFEKASRANLQQSLKMAVTKAANTPAVQIVLAFPLAIIVWIALQPGIMGDMTAGDFISYIGALGIMVKPVKALTDMNEKLQRGITAARSVFDVIDSEVEDVGGTHAPDRVRGDVEFRNVTFRYPGKDVDVLRGVDFRVSAGQTVALVGRSGGGKTTLSNLLPRFYDVTGGEILIDGVPVRDYALPALRRQMSLVPQRVTLFDDTVAANIAYGEMAGADMGAVKAAADAANASSFIEELPQGFATRIGQDGMHLSGGQRQRLAIARALLRDAPILILDEATSALDNESEVHIQNALERLMKDRTTFVIAHRLSTIERADLILVVSEGRVVEQGSHAQLLAMDGHYARLHRRNFADEPPTEEG
ncbi:MAG: lipid A export permease/ATP-binding protein MsbA [Pseudomonadota bacterium]